MDVETAIRARRTSKAFGPDPVPRETLLELLELGTWAPNHHLTEPWTFHVLGPETLARLKAAADELSPGSGAKLDRAPTLVAVTATVADDPVGAAEDLQAAGCAIYAVMLGATARGLASYWRTPAVLLSEPGRAALGLHPEEHCIGLLHLGTRRQEERVPPRSPVADVTRFLD